MKRIGYTSLSKMQAREGLTYSTTYVKQTPQQRRELTDHIRMVIGEIADAIDRDPELVDFIRTPLRGFKTTGGQNRSITDLITDMHNEARGRMKSGRLKDFAMAPIERWNKLFADTDYAVDLHLQQPKKNIFEDLVDEDYDESTH
jgi:hypothetical protein